MRRCFLGIDGGGTKTVCLVADETGQVLGAGLGGPVNLNFVSEETARNSIFQAVSSAWQAAGPPPSPPAVVATSGPMPPTIPQEVIRRETGGERIVGVGEEEAAWEATRPWLGDLACAVMVDAGTGSLAGGFNRQGERALAGGWGTILGDEGSGYWIGLEAMRAVARAEDGREPPTRLREAICQALQIKNPRELIPLVYQRGMGRREVAALCPVVAEVARQGDARAQAILTQAAQELALAAAAVMRKLGLTEEEFAVIPFGSVFKAGDLILAPFREAVQRVAPRAKIILPRYAPVVGTLLVAMRKGDVRVDDRVLARLEEGLRSQPLALA